MVTRKPRIPITANDSSKVLFACDYTCCVCRDRGRPVQIHHIDENPANNSDQNLAVLCLFCHNDTQLKGGFGRKLDSELLNQYRDDWIHRVALRREKADQLAALRMAGSNIVSSPTTVSEATSLMIPADEALVAYVQSLPSILVKAYAEARTRWDSGITSEMIGGTADVIDVVVGMLIHLSSWFPKNHFDGKPASEYFGLFVSSRFIWHRAIEEPEGVGTGGSIVDPSAAIGVLGDVKNAVEEIISALLWGRERFNLEAWRELWRLIGT